MTTTFVDVERPVRDWLRTQSVTGLAERVYVGVPSGATYPLLGMELIDGGVQPGDAPVADALIQFSVWGNTAADRTAVQAAAWALVAVLQATNHAVLDGLVLLGARIVTGPVPRFDPDGTPRYLIDAALTLRVP
jgi:hypothetical protein